MTPQPAKIFETKDQTTEDTATADKSAQTADGFDNFRARLGLNNDNTLSAGFYTFNLITRNRIQIETAYRGSWIVGQVVDTIAEDMTKAGVDISTAKEDQDVKRIQAEISKLGIHTSLCDVIRWGRAYGGALGVLQVEGQDMETPLDISTVGEGQFRGIAVYDRWQLQPDLTQVITVGPEIGLPKYYDIVTSSATGEPSAVALSPELQSQAQRTNRGGFVRVHYSRVIRNVGIPLMFWQAITEQMWGESVLERLWDRLIAFDTATMSAANLIERACNRTISVENLREILASGGTAKAALESMFDSIRRSQTNEGLTIIDKNDTFQTDQYTFAGLADVLIQFLQQISGASGIPLVRLCGQSPAGLNATGESDIRTYYDNVNSQQESKLRPGWDKILRLVWRSALGKDAPSDLEFTFVPLWQMSATDKAAIAKSNAETIAGALEAGLVSLSSGMKELRDQSKETGLFTNITDEDIADAEKAESEPPPDPSELGITTPPGAPVLQDYEKSLQKSEPDPKPKGQDSRRRRIREIIGGWVGR